MREICSLRSPANQAETKKIASFQRFQSAERSLLRGITVAMYIVGQERRLVDPPSQVVAGVRTVATQMDERCDAHVAALIRFFGVTFLLVNDKDSPDGFDSQSYFSVDTSLFHACGSAYLVK